MLRNNSLLFILLSLILISCSSKQSSQYNNDNLIRFDSAYDKRDLTEAWKHRDTLVFEETIDSLHFFSPHSVVLIGSNLSDATGYLWGFVNVDDMTWLDTLSLAKQNIIKHNIIKGFTIYKSSPLFMRKLPEPVMIFDKFEIYTNEPIPLPDNTQKQVIIYLDSLAKEFNKSNRTSHN